MALFLGLPRRNDTRFTDISILFGHTSDEEVLQALLQNDHVKKIATKHFEGMVRNAYQLELVAARDCEAGDSGGSRVE